MNQGRIATIAADGRYFTIDGRTRFLIGRTPTAGSLEGFTRHFEAAAAAGERVVRVHVDHGCPHRSAEAGGPGEASRRRSPTLDPTARAGEVDAAWSDAWERVIAAAEERGVWFVPVFSVWGNWNDSLHPPWHAWHLNPYNAANGGPAARPAELFGDTPCRRLFVEWLGEMVARWREHRNILCWEVFSELDLVTGATDVSQVVGFVERASAMIRERDPHRRPVTASLSGVTVWPELWRSEAIDVVQMHPYPGKWGSWDLMGMVASVAEQLEGYGKPVMIGEEGLDASPPTGRPDQLDRAHVGYRQAIWAAMMSGVCVGGMFWWISGYGPPEEGGARAAPMDGRHPGLARPASTFAERVDFSEMRRVGVATSEEVMALAMGDDKTIIGYARDNACVCPEWPARQVSGEEAKIATGWRGSARVTYYTPATLEVISRGDLTVEGGLLRLELPTFSEDLVVRIERAGA